MLGVSTYPTEYVDACRARVAAHLAAYDELVESTGTGPTNSFAPVFFETMLLALEASFVHRLRGRELKDGNPLNEVRVMCDSILLHAGVMTAEKSIKLAPERSVLGIPFGATISVDREGFGRLAEAFFAEIELKYR